MLLRRGILVIGAFAISGACAPAAPPQESDTTQEDIDAINRRHSEWIAAHEARDVERLMANWSEDAVLLPANEPTRSGKAAIEERTQAGVELFDVEDLSVEVHELQLAGDWAFIRQTFTANWIPRDGSDPVPEDSKEIMIFRRDSDGEWRIARYIWNGSEPPPEG
jgi:uncharacterized protein (TIGR02246 family)